jgi:hypothetical protein
MGIVTAAAGASGSCWTVLDTHYTDTEGPTYGWQITVGKIGGTYSNPDPPYEPPTFPCGTVSTTSNWVFTDECVEPEVFDEASGQCVELFDCDEIEGYRGAMTHEESFLGGPLGSMTCADVPSGEGECFVTNENSFCLDGICKSSFAFSDVACSGPDIENDEYTVPGPSAQCVSSAGVTLCFEPMSTNCGTVNGSEVCLDSVPSGNCVFLGNGGMVCGSEADAPPAPSTPDGMAAADPDTEFSANTTADGEGNTYNYFSTTTVNESGTPTDGSEGDEGEDESDSIELCGEGEDCEGTLPGEFEDVGTVLSITDVFVGRVQAAGIVAAVGGLGGSMPAGECPAPSTTIDYLAGMTLELDVHCGIWDEIASIIAGVMLAGWVFVGARILMSA